MIFVVFVALQAIGGLFASKETILITTNNIIITIDSAIISTNNLLANSLLTHFNQQPYMTYDDSFSNNQFNSPMQNQNRYNFDSSQYTVNTMPIARGIPNESQ